MLTADTRILRLIDANVNRCREGLRVIEDTARFVFDNESLYKKLRGLRHRVDRITRSAYPVLVLHRNAVADSGRTMREGRRAHKSAIIAANFRRVEESLRVLEEYGKLLSPRAGAQFKKVRFTVYTIEKNIHQLLADERGK
ncbi:MAG: thiamine-phosphate pyrophosphorylase [Endomicrobiales bacterium]|jgi:thiamine-phosphate pyrophosphorylase